MRGETVKPEAARSAQFASETNLPTMRPVLLAPKKRFLPFWPHYVLSELIAWYIVLGILIVLAALFPAGLEEKANAFVTPEHVKPEWYFLAVYQFLKVAAVLNFISTEAPKLIGIFAPAAGLALLFFLPFLDKGRKRPARQRPLMLLITVTILGVIIALTIWGQYS
jgi:quinol-cytochrome oxidoreductase complex cytochrome b subunit